MHKPDGCMFPNCFQCKLHDCQYDEDMIRKDKQAADKRRRRAAKPYQYLWAQRMQKLRMEKRDPGHYARLQRAQREKKKLELQSVAQEVSQC